MIFSNKNPFLLSVLVGPLGHQSVATPSLVSLQSYHHQPCQKVHILSIVSLSSQNRPFPRCFVTTWTSWHRNVIYSTLTPFPKSSPTAQEWAIRRHTSFLGLRWMSWSERTQWRWDCAVVGWRLWGVVWDVMVCKYELCGISLNRRFDCWWLPVVIIVVHADYTAQSERSDMFSILVLCLRLNGLARLRAGISSNIQPSPRPSAVLTGFFYSRHRRNWYSSQQK